jgi:hypothetical protein
MYSLHNFTVSVILRVSNSYLRYAYLDSYRMLCEYSAYRQNQFVAELHYCCSNKPRLNVVAIQLQRFSLQTNGDKWKPDTQHAISSTRWSTCWPLFSSNSWQLGCLNIKPQISSISTDLEFSQPWECTLKLFSGVWRRVVWYMLLFYREYGIKKFLWNVGLTSTRLHGVISSNIVFFNFNSVQKYLNFECGAGRKNQDAPIHVLVGKSLRRQNGDLGRKY